MPTTELQTIASATHVAHLDVFTGSGLLVLPAAGSDLYAYGMTSLNAAGWDAMLRDLRALGWEPLENEETGLPMIAGTTSEGRSVVSLYGLAPIVEQPSLDALCASEASLRIAAGMVP